MLYVEAFNRKMLLLAISYLLLQLNTLFSITQGQEYYVETNNGIVAGCPKLSVDGVPMIQYTVNYAKNPTGPLRFKVNLTSKSYYSYNSFTRNRNLPKY